MKISTISLVLLTFIFSCKTNQKEETIKSSIDSNIEIKKHENAVLFSGSLHRIDSLESHFIQSRPVDIWLPENYSEDKKYAVLYMHDGQMLFDSTTTWNKQEWKVDEWATKLMKQGKTKDFIVVGIHNIPKIRWQDLFPQKAFEILETKIKDSILKHAVNTDKNIEFYGDNYLSFVVKELKPIIDKTYSTLIEKEDTFIAGSSMGGLMSMYAICEYPNVFIGAACMSTHWPGATPNDFFNPISDGIFKYLKNNLPNHETHKLYFDYGTETLDAYYPKYAPKVDSIFYNAGFNELNYKNLKFEGTDHSENSWNKRLDIPLTFLLQK